MVVIERWFQEKKKKQKILTMHMILIGNQEILEKKYNFSNNFRVVSLVSQLIMKILQPSSKEKIKKVNKPLKA